MAVIPKAGEVFHSDDGSVSVVLPDPCDSSSVPTQEEIEEYAEWLGIDLEKEPSLLWVAREGLRTPLPAEWKACRTGEGEVYYFNFLTGESKWEHPTDEAFKEKVMEERAKLMTGGAGYGKAKKRNKSSATAGRGEEGAEVRRLEKGAAGHVETPKKSVKGTKTTTSTTPMSSPYTSPMTTVLTASAMRFGRLGALGTPAATQRVAPDVSGLLASSSTGERALTRFGFGGSNTSTSSSIGLAAGGLGVGIAAGKSLLTKTHDGVKGMEVQIRRRIDDDIEARRRAMRIRHEKQIMDERALLEKALQDAKETGEVAVAEARERQAEELKRRAQAELESLQQTLEKQHAEARARVASLRQKLEQEQTSLEGALQERLKEVRNEMQRRRIESATTQREVAAATLAKEKARLSEDLARQLEAEVTRLERDSKTTLEAFEKRLAAERAKLEKELDEKEKEQGGSDASSKAAEAAVQRAYEAALQRATSAASDAMDALRHEYRAKEDALQAEKQRKLQAKEASAVTASPVNAKHDDELKRREEEAAAEAAKLEQALKQKVAQYELETQRLVAAKQAEVNKARPSGGDTENREHISSISNNNNIAKAGRPTMTAVQEQREFDDALQRLETKHAQSMDRIRREHERILQEKKLFNPRQSPGYAERLQEEQELWLKANPPPDLTMPQLEPVPTFSGLMNASPAPMLNKADQQKRVDIAVMDAKEKRTVDDENKLAEVELMLTKEVKEAVTAYREERLREVEARLAQYQVRQAEEYRQRLDQTASTITEGVKALATRQSSPWDTAATAESLSRVPQPDGNTENVALRINEVSVEEAHRREEELRQRLQGRIETLEAMTRGARAALRQRQDYAQRRTRTPTAATPTNTTNATNTPVASKLPPTVPIDAFFSGRQEQQLTPGPLLQPQPQTHCSLTSVLNGTLSSIAPVNSLWSSARPSPMKQQPWLNAGNAVSPVSWHEKQPALGQDSNDDQLLHPLLSKQNCVLEDRLRRASLLLAERKEKLRAQHVSMMQARETWRQDMAKCRTQRDRNHALLLREVKVVLEEKARQLNRETLEVKQATVWLRKCMAEHKARLRPQPARHISAEDVIVAGNTTATTSCHIISMLEGLLARTELLESYVTAKKQPDTKPLHQTRHRSVSPGKCHWYHQ
ncbi:hypothetical protein TraAM80_02801 [Trypanosoma rangeli]|uniref:WW domain-containing protein n=1 Tax=Trypanosoma rangeli TaxID=5698 RepID=A0A422NS34_TRYRA|nr:uncharacterized protein TraAM80_02801 [Trypanosoma rangeli]RNF08295.1 hypothetical protein TraAM80_02801 [Trypanosoma rangeli]|eukprot:RNF08295.1 hypothetical protein TraAM80_02801 [Trypanosoma rangeli]